MCAVVINGGSSIVVAGADLDEMAAASAQDSVEDSRFRAWTDIAPSENRSWLASKARRWARGRS